MLFGFSVSEETKMSFGERFLDERKVWELMLSGYSALGTFTSRKVVKHRFRFRKNGFNWEFFLVLEFVEIKTSRLFVAVD